MIIVRVVSAILLLPLVVSGALLAQTTSTPVPASLVANETITAVDLLDQPARLSIEDVSLFTGLTGLQNRSGVSLVYSPSKLPRDHRVTCNCYGITVGEALDQLLDGTGMRYSVIEPHVLIEPASLPRPRVTGHVRLAGTAELRPTDTGRPVARVPLALLRNPGLAQQTGTIAGQVMEVGTQRPLAGVQVSIPGTGIGTLTNNSGRYLLVDVPAGEVEVRAQLIGYAISEQIVTVTDGETITADFELREAAIALDEIVVTGTVGATQKRAVGNAVAQVDAAELTAIAPVADVTQLLNARTPGVVVRPPSGLAGAGAQITIRGRSSISLAGDPLIYVDGIRMNSATPTGGSGPGAASRLNDINPEDIESVEIIKGPAAATLYGTEASNGVIQIITKRGKIGEPRIEATVRYGAAWVMDPAGRWPINYYREPSGEVIEFNIIEAEAAAGRSIFRTGHLQGYALNVSGGSEELRYYISGNYDHNEGALPSNQAEQITGQANLTITPEESFEINSNLGFTLSRVDFGPSSGIMFDAVLNRPGNRDGPSRGFFRAPPEAWLAAQSIEQNVNRFTGGVEVQHRPAEWFIHRLRTGIDLSNRDNIELVPLLDAETAQFFSAGFAAGSKEVDQANTFTTTVDYSATATLPVSRSLSSATSAGLQYYRSNIRFLSAEGREFPASGITSIEGAALRFGSDDQIENVTVGVFVQEQLSWNNRLFLTGAVRADDNSAFGQEFDLVIYPKLSGSWVVNEEPFWNVPFISTLRLRAAYGESGQQPEAFASLRTFQPITGQAGAPAVTPQFVGNPELGPERGQEIEVGFESGLFNGRIGIEFTYYSQRTKDAIVLRDVAPSSGFYRQQFVNLGEIMNQGIELQLRGSPILSERTAWNLVFNLATNDNEIVSLGLEDAEYLEFGIARNRHQPGYPVNAYFSRKIVSAEHGPDGYPINILCADGEGGAVACSEAPRLYAGRPDPNVEGSFTSTLTLFNRITLFGMLDFKAGHSIWSSSLWCPGILGCEDEVYPERFDPVYAASSVLGITDDARWVTDVSFAKFRELSLRYALPDDWARGFGASRASITVAGRNLYTWTPFKGLDPENVASFARSGLQFEQNEVPQLAQFITTVNVSF